MRNLASIQKIRALEPIQGKDRIELASILGWQVIVEKGMHRVGDLVVYCEVDSILPEHPAFEFLRSRCYSPRWKGFRIRTLKFGDAISQGIVFPLSLLDSTKKMTEGTDVTEFLKIRKYDPEELAYQTAIASRKRGPFMTWLFKFAITRWVWRLLYGKDKKGPWPDYIIKTDETRIQNVPNILNDYGDLRVYITEKMDGQSASYAYHDKKLVVCSRNLWLKTPTNSNWWIVARKYDMEKKLKLLAEKGLDVVIQGEICGPGIQGNKYNLGDLQFFMFSAINKKTRQYVDYSTLMQIQQITELPTVPVLEVDRVLNSIAPSVPAVVEYARSWDSRITSGVIREGVVIRSMDGKPGGVRGLGIHFSFKVINPDFLLKFEDA